MKTQARNADCPDNLVRAGPVCISPALCYTGPFGVYVFFMVISDMLAWLGVSEFILLWLYPFRIILVLAVLWFCRRAYTDLGSVLTLPFRSWMAGLSTGTLVFCAWISLDSDWMRSGVQTEYSPFEAGPFYVLLIAFRFAGASLAVPLMEELFWRSFLLRFLVSHDFRSVSPSGVRMSGFIVVSVLFAVEHNYWLAGLVAGCVFNFLYISSRSLIAVALAHATANALLGIWVIHFHRWDYW